MLAPDGRLDRCGHRLRAACGHVGVEVDGGVGVACVSVGHEALLAYHIIVPGLDCTAILAGEGPKRRVVGILGVIPDVGALQGREHGVPAIADIIGFHEDRAAHRGARAVLGNAVVVVVVDVRRVEAHAGVARVAVVEPIVVVVDVVPGGGVLAQAQHTRFSVVPKMIVGRWSRRSKA